LTRPIRSYVLRQGRTTPAQQRALDELLPKYGIPFSRTPIDPKAVFGRPAPLVVEIGSGMGETTAEIARARRDTDFIAIEVHGPGVGSLLNRIDAERLENVRVIRHDAAEVLECMFTDASLAGVYLFFPDPWPKKRHHKRRLVQGAFITLVARKLAPAGILHAATDWPDYAAQIEALGAAERLLERLPQIPARPATKFERRGVRLGHPVRDLAFRKRID
jgi:tRNA (guanine-N7-)-methyltransferase